MARRWKSFDLRTTNKEFLALPSEDFRNLTRAMKAHRLETRSGYVVKNYGDGLMMLKDASGGQVRCLFFSVSERTGIEL